MKKQVILCFTIKMKRIGETNGKMRKKCFRAFDQGKILNNCIGRH